MRELRSQTLARREGFGRLATDSLKSVGLVMAGFIVFVGALYTALLRVEQHRQQSAGVE